MNSRIFILSKTEVKILLAAGIIGGILQIVCWNYLKNHPELLEDDNSEKVKPKKPGLRRFSTRGGAFVELTGAKLIINGATAMLYISKKGVLTTIFLVGSGIFIKKVPSKAISTVVRNALPVTHSGLEKGYILVDGKKIVLNKCDQSLKYLFQVLNNKDLTFKDKKDASFKILMEHVDLKTTAGRIRFVLCIFSILHILTLNDSSSYYALMQSLIEAIKSGKISKKLARLIIRKLRKLNVAIDPELIEVASGA